MTAALATAMMCPAAANPTLLVEAYHRAASPVSDRGTMTSRYAYSGGGLEGTATSVVDLATGNFRKTQRAGIVVEGEGFDGHHAWLRDLSSFAKQEDGGDKPALAVNAAYRNSDGWWRPDRGGAQLQPIGCDAVRVTPRGGKPFEAWFDPTSHLLARVREIRSFGAIVDMRFSGYERRQGRLVPTVIESITGDDPASKETLTLREIVIAAPQPASAYAMPTDNPPDWRLPVGGQVTLPFRLFNNHIIVDVKVDRRGPFPFLIDTGGHNILTPSTLAALAMQPQGASPSSGAGESTVSSGYARVRELDAGGAALIAQTVVTLDFSPLAVEGLVLGGMLGSEFLERFVVTIDYGKRTLTLTDPARFETPGQVGNAVAIPMTFYEHMPQIRGTIDGMPVRLDIDTGARDEVTLTSPFVAANALRSRYPDGVLMTTGWGVGGPSRTYTARAGSISLGLAKVPRPAVNLSSAIHGSYSDRAYDGNVGNGLLKRFVVTFDYGRSTMYLRPIAKPDVDVGRIDRVGMWINLGDEGLKVTDVVAGGPADQAGLRIGDVVTMVDGTPFGQRSLSDTRRALKLASLSKPLEIRYRRIGAAAVALVRPRNLIPD